MGDAVNQAIDMVRLGYFGDRISREEAELWVRDALAAGRVLGRTVRSRYPKIKPGEIALKLGLPVVDGSDNPFLRALYSADPPAITVYPRSLQSLQERLDQMEPEGRVSARELAIAHELFHHFEAETVPVRDTHQLTIFKIGRWRCRLPVRSLSELGAHSFARELMGLHYYPFQLEVIQVGVKNDELSSRLVEEPLTKKGCFTTSI